jgi:two-component system sensor histidine kinase KdpD
VKNKFLGAAIGVASSVVLGAAMLPLRAHLSIATAALVLVVPVVTGVVTGGFIAGLVSVVAGFLVYDLVFIPPYWNLSVGRAQHWVALGVYGLVMVLVARVVSDLDAARAASITREKNARRLFELSELLLGDKEIPELGKAIVEEMRATFKLSGATLLLSIDGRLEVVGSSGSPIDEADLVQLAPNARVPVALSTLTSKEPIQTLALVAAGRPVGLLVLRGLPDERSARELLPTLANHLAIALERAQLRERVLKVELLEQIDRLRRALLGAVSHDLRTPLATIKFASSTLLDPSACLPEEDIREMHSLIDEQADRLTRRVNNLLDMTRIQAGVLEVRRAPWSVSDLATEVIEELRSSLEDQVVELDVPDSLPLVDIDHLLIEQVLSNLLDNAHRHSPPGRPIVVAARRLASDHVAVSVTDQGPGVPVNERSAVFESFVSFDTGRRAGLGLAIAKAFIEAHGGEIGVEDPPGGGAHIVFTLPIATSEILEE